MLLCKWLNHLHLWCNRVDWMPVQLRAVCPGVYGTPAITFIKEIRLNRFPLTDFNSCLRYPLNRFRFPRPSIISNQDIQIILYSARLCSCLRSWFTRIDWMPVLLRSVCPGVYRTPAITIIKETRPTRFPLTDLNLRLRHPLNRFRFPFRSIISNQDIQMIRNAVWFLLARPDLPVFII